MFFRVVVLGIACMVSFACPSHAAAETRDWPTFGHDAYRNAATEMKLSVPLRLMWVHQPALAPVPSWPPPARFDYWHEKEGLRPRVTFDHAYHLAVVGNRVFYGSSADDSVVCLDASTGANLWTFYTEGPVRLAPTIADRRVYVGSDDGRVYCLSAERGQLIWQQQAGPAASRFIGNGRVIARWPVRSGVLVADGMAYCAAGLFPKSEGVYLVRMNAVTGAVTLRRKIDRSVQGYMALMRDRLILPTGRTGPAVFRRDDGKFIGDIASAGGTYTVVSKDVWATGSGDLQGELSLAQPESGERLITLRGRHLIGAGNMLFVHGGRQLAALDRHQFLPLAQRHATVTQQLEQLNKEAGSRDAASANSPEAASLKQELESLKDAMQACWLWKSSCDQEESLILCGDQLVAGGDGVVVGYSRDAGEPVWRTRVEGRACGLAAASGKLFVSTASGKIYCFAARAAAESPARSATAARPHEPAGAHPANPDRELAAQLLDRLDGDQGFCLVFGDEAAELAAEIAEQSRLRVLLVASTATAVETARDDLRGRRLLGSRVVVHRATPAALSYPPYFANLMVLLDGFRETVVRRCLRPEGGVAWCRTDGTSRTAANEVSMPSGQFAVERVRAGRRDWTVLRRGAIPGAGQWTHGLADPGNSACSGDQLVQGPLRIQWFGRPGPREMADRHHRSVAPLYRSGRLFVPGDNRIMAVDAYNGFPLWERAIPHSLRLGAFLDSSNMVVDGHALYLAAETRCLVLDAMNGNTLQTLPVPSSPQDDDLPRHWGYLARVDQYVVGSACKPDAAYYRQSRQDDLALWYDDMSLVTSDRLFSMHATTGQVQWRYQSGVIVNTTIAIGDRRVYFLECHAPRALENPVGRVPMSALGQGTSYLVALDLQTGKPVWKRPLDLANYQHIVYLNFSSGKLVISGNRYVSRRLWYFLQAIDARSGDDLWEASHNSGFRPGGDHGEQNRHPTIVGDTVFLYPQAYNLHTGSQVEGWRFDRMGHGCGNLSASADSLFWRGGNPWQCDLQGPQLPVQVNGVNRPGCYINLIPAGGLLLMPEASSGCTCGYALQTSLAYVPASRVE